MRLAPMFLLCAVQGCSPGGTGSSMRADACTIAVRFTEAWLGERGGGPVVISDAPESAPPRPVPGAWRSPSGAPGEAPSSSMMAAAATLSADSAVARCPALRAYLERARIPYGASAVKAVAEGRAPGDSYPAEIFSLSLPSVSADGTEALVATGTVLGPEAGSGAILLLKQQSGGSWRVVSIQPSWIS